VHDDETIVIADYLNHRITGWKPGATTGQVVAGGNKQGNQMNQLNCPTDVIIDNETDSIIICDRWNERVMNWSRQQGTTTGEVLISNILCYGLTIDDQRHLYVTDTRKQEVRRFKMNENTDTLVAGGNGIGNRFDQFNEPRYVFVDREYAVYVTDYKNDRVMKWVKDATEGIVVAGGRGEESDLTQSSLPNGIFVDKMDTIFVAGDEDDRVKRWFKGMKQGTVIVGGNGVGEEANQLNAPIGLSFDRDGNLYVAEYNNHRVQRFLIENN
jgi:sugar lactone lactonase YvrE